MYFEFFTLASGWRLCAFNVNDCKGNIFLFTWLCFQWEKEHESQLMLAMIGRRVNEWVNSIISYIILLFTSVSVQKKVKREDGRGNWFYLQYLNSFMWPYSNNAKICVWYFWDRDWRTGLQVFSTEKDVC